jgi:hypothetical protein
LTTDQRCSLVLPCMCLASYAVVFTSFVATSAVSAAVAASDHAR